MSALDGILAKLESALGEGLSREPQAFLYLDHAALYEHFKAVTGLNQVPVGVSRSTGASAGAGLFGLKLGVSGSSGASFDLSEPHLFESIEPLLRERHPAVSGEDGVAATLRGFGWFRGSLGWMRVGPTMLKDKEIEPVRVFTTLETCGSMFPLACTPRYFSPFVPFLHQDPHLHLPSLDVEVLAYNSGVLTTFAANTHARQGKGLVLVPTAILADPDADRQALEGRLRELNDGQLSREFPRRRNRD